MNFKHYIRIDAQNSIIYGFSDAYGEAQPGDICINDAGGEQFRLVLGGEDNTPLTDSYGVPMYKWDNAVVQRPESEMLADRPTHIEAARQDKMREASASCTSAIHSGIQIGAKHYSLTEYDQLEIMTQQGALDLGVEAVLYHADGEPYRLYPADDFQAVATAAREHILGSRLYCNHLFQWIRRADYPELRTIYYGAELPEDLKESFNNLKESENR